MNFYNSVGTKTKKKRHYFFNLRKETHENIIKSLNKIISLTAVVVICVTR